MGSKQASLCGVGNYSKSIKELKASLQDARSNLREKSSSNLSSMIPLEWVYMILLSRATSREGRQECDTPTNVWAIIWSNFRCSTKLSLHQKKVLFLKVVNMRDRLIMGILLEEEDNARVLLVINLQIDLQCHILVT